MIQTSLVPFATLLKRYRQARGWTQDELARQAGVSMRTVSDIERGLSRMPHRDTVQLLVRALAITDHERAAFEDAARQQMPTLAPSVPTTVAGLPAPVTAFIGRETELQTLTRLLQHTPTRLLTILGPAGIGKTRLAIALAGQVLPFYGDGAFFIDLAAVTTTEQAIGEIAYGIGIREDRTNTLAQSLALWLHQRRLLLVLDNFEQALPAAGLVASLLQEHPRLTIIITSRVPLKIAPEHLFTTAALTYPDPRRLPHITDLAAYPAIALFLDRARLARTDFALTVGNAATIARICARMEGLPLALELVAAQVRALSLPQILAQLSGREESFLLRLLAPRAADQPRRQQTLAAAIAWSYDLLEAPLQILFRRLCVFQGDFDEEAARAVCDPHESLALDVAAGLILLQDHSLLQPRATLDAHAPPRFTILAVIRSYGLDLLRQRQEEEDLRRQHATYYATLLEGLEAGFSGKQQAPTLAQFAQAYDNTVAAMHWARVHQDGALGLRLVAPLWWFWEKRGMLSEGRQWIEGMLAILHPESDHIAPRHMSRALYGAAILTVAQGDLPHGFAFGQACLHWCQQADSLYLLARAYLLLGTISKAQGDPASAIDYFTQCLTIVRASGDDLLGATLNNLSATYLDLGDLAHAQPLLVESVEQKRLIGDRRGVAVGLINLSELLKKQEAFAQASAAALEARDHFQALDDRQGIAMALNNLGEIAQSQGDFPLALARFQESLHLFEQAENRPGMAMVYDNLSLTYTQLHDLAQARASLQRSLTLYQAMDNSAQVAQCQARLASLP